MSKEYEEEKLSTNELEDVAGGIGEAEAGALSCPICGSTNIRRNCIFYYNGETAMQYTCRKCGFVWGARCPSCPMTRPIRNKAGQGPRRLAQLEISPQTIHDFFLIAQLIHPIAHIIESVNDSCQQSFGNMDVDHTSAASPLNFSLTSIKANPRILLPFQLEASNRLSSSSRMPQAQILSDPAHSTR